MNKRSQTVWNELVKAAKAGAPCPTNAELSASAGYAYAVSASNVIRRWVASKAITLDQRNGNSRRIKINGKWTGWTEQGQRRAYHKRGHRPAGPGSRVCLSCTEMFVSAWNGERICGRCKSTAIWRGNAIAI